MANGFFIESAICATNILPLNRYCVAEIDVDGGNLVALTAPTEQGDDVWTAEAPASDGQGNLWVAYNPNFRYTEIGEGEYAGISNDVRDYTNRAGKTFTAFKPVENVDLFVISQECVDEASRASVVAGSVLQAKAGQTQWTLVADKTDGATAVSVMFPVVIPFPAKKGSLGMTSQKGFKVQAV